MAATAASRVTLRGMNVPTAVHEVGEDRRARWNALLALGPEVDAKRKSAAAGIEGWFPYYAGFNIDFAVDILAAAELPTGSVVLDPWNGSGTTTLASAEMDVLGIGVDLNPVACLVASAKLVNGKELAGIWTLIRQRAEGLVSERSVRVQNDPLDVWLAPAMATFVRQAVGDILTEIDSSGMSGAPCPLAASLILGLCRASREFAGIRQTSNPTWVRPSGTPPVGSVLTLIARWEEIVLSMAADVSARVGAYFGRAKIHCADAMALPLNDASVDFVLSSPPYCTRIDYVVSTSFELAVLGFEEQGEGSVSALRREITGAPLAKASFQMPKEGLPAGVEGVLSGISSHSSKASATYYHRTYAQYFAEMSRSLIELKRVLKPGGICVLVVQDSYYKSVHVRLEALLMEVAEFHGFKSGLVGARVDVRALTSINSKSRKHRKKSSYTESVIAFQREE